MGVFGPWIACCFLVGLLSEVVFSTPCRIPPYVQGDYYSLQNGNDDLNFYVKRHSILDRNTKLEADCIEWDQQPNITQNLGSAVTRILARYKTWDRCYMCYEVTYKTQNILKVIRSACLDLLNPESDGLNRMCGHINRADRPQIWFKKIPDPVNCNLTFSGNYSFSYSSCDSHNNLLEACFNPLTDFQHNEVLWLNFGQCRGESFAFERNNMQLKCMGSWPDEDGWFYSALMDPNELYYKHRFLCLRHTSDRSFTMSTIAYCYFDTWHATVDISLTSLEVCPQYLYSSCTISEEFIGEYHGEEEAIEIHVDGVILGSGQDTNCYKKRPGTGVNVEGSIGVMRSTEVMLRWDDPDKKYYEKMMCIKLTQRTPNVIQYTKSPVLSSFKYNQEKPDFDVCDDRKMSHVFTIFKTSLEPQICSPTQLLANYKFSYRNSDDIDTCKSEMNTAEGCPLHGSDDGELHGVFSTNFNMTFGSCEPTSNVSISASYSFVCLGSWEDPQGNFIVALFDTSNPSPMEAFRCLLTSKSVIQPINEGFPYVMSEGSECRQVVSPYEGPVQLEFFTVAECIQTTTTSIDKSTVRHPIDQELVGDYWVPIDGSISIQGVTWPYVLMAGYLVTCFDHVMPG